MREGLAAAYEAEIPVTIVTEEKADRCRKFVVGHQLEGLIADIVSVRKTSAAYRDLKRSAGMATCFMVGDQIDRDIVAASEAGFSTFYFPGGFEPFWNAGSDIGGARRIDRYDSMISEILIETGHASVLSESPRIEKCPREAVHQSYASLPRNRGSWPSFVGMGNRQM